MEKSVKVLFTVIGNDLRTGKPFSNKLSYNFSVEQAEYGRLGSHDVRLTEKCETAADKLTQAFEVSGTNVSVTYEVQ